MAHYFTDEDVSLIKVAGNIGSLSAEPVAIGTTRTGQNDTVVEYYVSSDGNTAYRKYASGWKEFYTIHNVTVIGIADVTLPDGFFSKILNVEILPHSGTENTTIYISKYYVTSTLSNIRFANVYYASSSNAGYNTGKAFVKVVGY